MADTQRHQDRGQRGHARCVGHGVLRTFQLGESAFEAAHGRLLQALE